MCCEVRGVLDQLIEQLGDEVRRAVDDRRLVLSDIRRSACSARSM
jgi:hypothetical protein